MNHFLTRRALVISFDTTTQSLINLSNVLHLHYLNVKVSESGMGEDLGLFSSQ